MGGKKKLKLCFFLDMFHKCLPLLSLPGAKGLHSIKKITTSCLLLVILLTLYILNVFFALMFHCNLQIWTPLVVLSLIGRL